MSRPAAKAGNNAARRGAPDSAGLAARRTALEILIRVDQHRAFADVLLGHRLDEFPVPADRRLVTHLVLGTIAWQGRLDYELARLSSRPLVDLDPAVLAILRVGLFQLRFTDRVPRHAAVNTAVNLAKEAARTKAAAGLVNAVLRRAARGALALPPREPDEVGHLAIAWSHPRWLVEKFIRWFGTADAERLMAANNEAAPNVLRLNLALASRETLIANLMENGLEIEEGDRLPETVMLKSAPPASATRAISALCYPQSEASQWVARMLAPARGAIVVDCAAAPGGKATHLAELVGPDGRIVALDSNLAGLRRARALAGQLGHRNMYFTCADLAAAPPLREASQAFVMLDAPCTGLGTLREHPEIRWRLAPGDPARMAALQARMLDCAAALLRPGGALVYAVCSLAPEEGPELVHDFLARSPQFAVDRNPPVPSSLAQALQADGTLATRPDSDRDGFFAARLIRAS